MYRFIVFYSIFIVVYLRNYIPSLVGKCTPPWFSQERWSCYLGEKDSSYQIRHWIPALLDNIGYYWHILALISSVAALHCSMQMTPQADPLVNGLLAGHACAGQVSLVQEWCHEPGSRRNLAMSFGHGSFRALYT